MAEFFLNWKLFSKVPSILYVHLPISDTNCIIKSVKLSKNPEEIVKNKYYSYAKFLAKEDFEVSANVDAKVKRIDKFKGKKESIFLENEKNLLMNETKKYSNNLKSAREVYEYIINNFGQPENTGFYFKDLLDSNLNDLKLILKTKKAMCGGKSALFVSICRNMGVPARVVTGYFLRDGWTLLKNAKEHDNFMDLHVWAEYYEKGYWRPVDINIAQQTGKDYFDKFPNKIFDRLDRRIIVSKGSSFKLDNINLDYLQTATYSKGNNLKVSLKILKL
jgi:hypothetical protein